MHLANVRQGQLAQREHAKKVEVHERLGVLHAELVNGEVRRVVATTEVEFEDKDSGEGKGE